MKESTNKKVNNGPKFLVSKVSIQDLILEIRGQRVMLDADLARLYGVPTKRLNEQVKRNIQRFPEDFMFRLTQEEKDKVVAICDHLQNLRFSGVLPYVFTEHGALMLSAVLKSELAVSTSIEVVRAFTKMRSMLAGSRELAKQIDSIEKKVTQHDKQFKQVFDAIRSLILVGASKKPVGFHVNMKFKNKGSSGSKNGGACCARSEPACRR